MAEPVDLVVDRGVLLDVEVLRRDVGLGLVVVVVADEVLDGVVGEELPELVAELRRQRLVVGDHQRRPLHALDRRGHREGLAGAGRAEQRLDALLRVESLGEAVDRLRLVGRRRVGRIELELRHPTERSCRSYRKTASCEGGGRVPRSMPGLLLGPMLRYVSETEATVWVETDGPCEVEVLGRRDRTFCVDGHHYALVCLDGPRARLVAGVRGEAGRRARLAAAESGFPPSRAADPRARRPLRIVFGSCRVAVPHHPALHADQGRGSGARPGDRRALRPRACG